jgi:hypothetical protein
MNDDDLIEALKAHHEMTRSMLTTLWARLEPAKKRVFFSSFGIHPGATDVEFARFLDVIGPRHIAPAELL